MWSLYICRGIEFESGYDSGFDSEIELPRSKPSLNPKAANVRQASGGSNLSSSPVGAKMRVRFRVSIGRWKFVCAQL